MLPTGKDFMSPTGICPIYAQVSTFFSVPITYIIPFFLGVGDVLLKFSMMTLIVKNMPGKSVEAFALYEFYQVRSENNELLLLCRIEFW